VKTLLVATTGMEIVALDMDPAASNSVKLQAHGLAHLAHYLVASHGHPRVDQVLLDLLARNDTTPGMPELSRSGG
jgi:hypothetical protein